MSDNLINTFKNDMASATGAKLPILQSFGGEPSEDVTIWTADSKFLLSLYDLTEDIKRKIIFSSLKGKAFSWARITVTQKPQLTMENLLKDLNERFGSRMRITETAQRFLRDDVPETSEKFFEMLNDANYLLETSYMSLNALADRIISRSPSEIRTALWSLAGQVDNFFEFIKQAEKVVPLAYGKEGSMRINVTQQINFSKTFKKAGRSLNSKKWCEFHRNNSHSTEMCLTLKKIKEQGWTKNEGPKLNVARCESRDDHISGSEEINSNFYLRLFSEKLCTNPFLVKGNIEGKETRILLDTGADLTLIPLHILPDTIKINRTAQTARAANGLSIPIKGQVENILIEFNKLKVLVKLALITNNRLPYILLGAPTIKENLKSIFNEPDQNIRNNQFNSIQGSDSLLKSQAEEIKSKYSDIFASEITPSKLCTIKRHKIKTGNHQPVCQRGHRVQIYLEEQVQQEINKLKQQGIIRPSESPWRSCLVVVPKDGDKIRLCVDYRALNEITEKNTYPLPRIDEIMDHLSKAKIFSTLDATSGYHQIALEEEDMKKTAFAWKGELYEYTRMPFGLCNAPATFQSIMNTILKQENWKFAIPYLDDIIIFSNSLEEHKEHLSIILGKLKAAGITLNNQKSALFQREIPFLGSIISSGIIKPDPEKIKAIMDFKLPSTLRELRSFLGVANFCGEYIKHYATIAGPLTDLLQGEIKNSQKQILWTTVATESFEKLKNKIADITSRAQPDLSKEFILTTDASDTAMGAVLSQIGNNGKEKMISTFSKKFVKAQMNYSTTDKEALALEKGILHYDHYLRGKTFTLKTDHQALQYIKTASNQNSRILRTSLKLQEYSFKPMYIKGDTNIADIFSRPRVENQIQSITGELEETDKNKILQDVHLISGHGSVSNMKFLLSSRNSWKGIYKDIEKFVEKCSTCNKSGEALINSQNKAIRTTYPNELWEIDLIGRIPGKNLSNSFIFIAIDHYSKWIETKQIKRKSAEDICEAIEELIIKRNGIPNKILTDQGLEFNNELTKKLSDKYKINWIFASPRHHETVGAVERANQTLMGILKRLTNFNSNLWPKYLEAATFAYNISFHRAINTSPYKIKWGKDPTLKLKLEENQEELDKAELMKRRDVHFETYKKAIEKGKRTVPYDLRIGEPVLIFNPPLSEKFKAKWQEGYQIKKFEHPDAYIVVKDGKEYRVNKSHVKRNKSHKGILNGGGEMSYINQSSLYPINE
jgi:hypothetical protein